MHPKSAIFPLLNVLAAILLFYTSTSPLLDLPGSEDLFVMSTGLHIRHVNVTYETQFQSKLIVRCIVENIGDEKPHNSVALEGELYAVGDGGMVEVNESHGIFLGTFPSGKRNLTMRIGPEPYVPGKDTLALVLILEVITDKGERHLEAREVRLEDGGPWSWSW